MRLNDGAPVWHVSVSIWAPRVAPLRPVRSPGVAERHAVRLLAGCGGDREWWYWNTVKAIGHLRVALTPAEVAVLPVFPAEHDAGPSGPQRPRTVIRRR